MAKCPRCGRWAWECFTCCRSLGCDGGPKDCTMKILCVIEDDGPKHFCSMSCWKEYHDKQAKEIMEGRV